jgi:membrane-associated phospholipid phosphatase
LKTQAYWHFRVAAAFSLLLALLIGIFLSTYGKNASFLIINKFNHPGFDYFFHYYTYLGDGMICIPLLLYVYLFKKEFFFTVIVAFLICALLTQFSKGVVFAGQPRPILVLKEQVRAVPGVEVHTTGSFPSGHTSMAFTYALLMTFLVKRKFWTFLFPIIAFFVGYSRVYLAQHFVTDVLAGLIVGLTSAFLALLMYERFKRERKEATEPIEEA